MSREKELARIATLENELSLLNKSISQYGKSKQEQYEDTFLELMNQGLTIKFDKDNRQINYYDKDGGWLISQELKMKYIHFSYWRFWSVYNFKFKLNDKDIRTILTDLIDRHLGLSGYRLICDPTFKCLDRRFDR